MWPWSAGPSGRSVTVSYRWTRLPTATASVDPSGLTSTAWAFPSAMAGSRAKAKSRPEGTSYTRSGRSPGVATYSRSPSGLSADWADAGSRIVNTGSDGSATSHTIVRPQLLHSPSGDGRRSAVTIRLPSRLNIGSGSFGS